MRELKYLEPVSVGKIYGLTTCIFGFLIGVFIALFGSLLTLGSEELGAGFGMLSGGMAMIFFPIFYGILGFVAGTIGALLYNLFAGWVGGIQFKIDDEEEYRDEV